MLWKVPEKKKTSLKELVFGSSGLVISLPNELVERWICRPIPLPAQRPVHHLPGRTGGERKGGGSLRVALASAVTSSSCPKQWPLSVLHFNLIPPTSRTHLINSQHFTKENQEQGGRDSETELLVSQGARGDAKGQMSVVFQDGWGPQSLTFSPVCYILLLPWEVAPSLTQGAVGRSLYVLVAQSCLTARDPTDCSSPGSSVHGILRARILEWVAIPFSK